MFKRIVLAWILLLALTMCVSQDKIATPDRSQLPVLETPFAETKTSGLPFHATPTVTITLPPTPTSVPIIATQLPLVTRTAPSSTTSMPTATTQAPSLVSLMEMITPTLLQVCPLQAEVTLQEIGLDPEFRLVLMENNDDQIGLQKGVWVLSPAVQAPQQLPNTVSKSGQKIGVGRISPSGKWILLYRWDSDDYEHRVFWVSSIDGNQQWDVYTTETAYAWVVWVSDDEIVVLDVVPGRSGSGHGRYGDDVIPVLRINPFTLEMQNLAMLPNRAVLDGSFTLEGNLYSIYHEGLEPYQKFTLYDYAFNASVNILSWLVGDKEINFGNSAIIVSKNAWITAKVDKPYGFDLAIDLDIQAASQPKAYDEMMKAYYVSDQPLAGGSIMHIPGRNWLDIGMVYENYEPSGKYYILDYASNIIREYCFSHTPAYYSMDGHFSAFKYFDPSGGTLPVTDEGEIVILDLETGQYARIKGYKVIGWGLAENP